MKPIRVLFLLTGLVATASAVHAQTPPAPPPWPSAGIIGTVASPECPAIAAPCWYIQALKASAATLQNLRTMCSTGPSPCKQGSACCDAASVKGVGCGGLGIAGHAKCCDAVQAPKACCCVKACACCESCKVGKESVQAPAPPAWNPFGVVRMQWSSAMPAPFPVLAGLPCLPPQAAWQTGVQAVATPTARVVQVMQVAHQIKPVHLVTPDLDAHCERMHHRGDMVVLEGNVLLLCRKHAQPIRIEAQRVVVNMRDGSFTVESDASPRSTLSIGVMPTSGLMPATNRMIQLVPAPTPAAPGVLTPD